MEAADKITALAISRLRIAVQLGPKHPVRYYQSGTHPQTHECRLFEQRCGCACEMRSEYQRRCGAVGREGVNELTGKTLRIRRVSKPRFFRQCQQIEPVEQS